MSEKETSAQEKQKTRFPELFSKRSDNAIYEIARAGTIIIVIIALLIYWLLFDFTSLIDGRLKQMTEEYLEEIGSQAAENVNLEMERMMLGIQSAVTYLSEKRVLSASNEDFMVRSLKENCGFSDVWLVSADGNIRSWERREQVEKNEALTEKLFQGESGMTDVFTCDEVEKPFFAFYAPIKKNGAVSGGLIGIRTVEEKEGLTQTSVFGGRSHSYVIKTDGTIVIQDNHPDILYNGKDFFTFLEKKAVRCSLSAEALREKMKNGEKGFFNYEAGGRKRAARYEPAGLNDWYIVTIIPEDATSYYIKEIKKSAVYLTVKVILIFALSSVLLWCWFQKTRGLMLQSKEEAELEKKKLEITLKHTANATFEYKLREDRLDFINGLETLTNGVPKQIPQASARAAGMGLIDPAYLNHFCQMIRQAAEGEEPAPREVEAGFAFSPDSWLRISMTLIKDSSGHVLSTVGTVEDITEEKRIKRRYAQEEQYREALLSEAVAVWSVDLLKQQLLYCTAVGKNCMEARESYIYSASFLKSIHIEIYPEDRDRIRRFIQTDNLLAAYYTGKRDLREQFRVIYPGEMDYKWVSCTISLLSEPTTGNPIAFAYLKDVDEETRRKIELTFSSERDPLTGLYNRRNIRERANAALDQGDISCLMMLDMDGFKEINDSFGHQEGDRVLKMMADILSHMFREEDLVARFGGDEFIVFLSGFTNREWVYERAEEVRKEVCGLTIRERKGRISVSIGLSFAPEDGEEFDTLFEKADEALYTAKRDGKNRIVGP